MPRALPQPLPPTGMPAKQHNLAKYIKITNPLRLNACDDELAALPRKGLPPLEIPAEGVAGKRSEPALPYMAAPSVTLAVAMRVVGQQPLHNRIVLRCRGPTRGPWTFHVNSMGRRNRNSE
jgi:hypothetical protein